MEDPGSFIFGLCPLQSFLNSFLLDELDGGWYNRMTSTDSGISFLSQFIELHVHTYLQGRLRL